MIVEAAMHDEDDARPVPKRLVSLNLDPLGVAELGDYIAELQAEIVRVEAAVTRKRSQRGIADSFFKP